MCKPLRNFLVQIFLFIAVLHSISPSRAQNHGNFSMLDLQQFYHLHDAERARSGLMRHLLDHFSGKTRDDFVTAMTGAGYQCLHNNDPSVSAEHVTCAHRTKGTWLPLRWPEFWRIQAIFDSQQRLVRLQISRFIENPF